MSLPMTTKIDPIQVLQYIHTACNALNENIALSIASKEKVIYEVFKL